MGQKLYPPVGSDTTTAKMVGGRFGLRYQDLKVGLSMTADHTNQSDLGVSKIRRLRLGGDLSFTWERTFSKANLSGYFILCQIVNKRP